MAIAVIAFSFMYDVGRGRADAPHTPLDLVDPQWKGKIASSYPHDDDAVLYLYALYAEKYGWDWLAKLRRAGCRSSPAAATPRATRSPAAEGDRHRRLRLADRATAAVRWVCPTGTRSWPGASAPRSSAGQANPTAAKLYLNWQLSTDASRTPSTAGRSAPTSPRPAGLKPIWEYPNANLDGFPRFMADRAEVERWKQTFALYFGEVKGDPTPGWLGLHPGA